MSSGALSRDVQATRSVKDDGRARRGFWFNWCRYFPGACDRGLSRPVNCAGPKSRGHSVPLQDHPCPNSRYRRSGFYGVTWSDQSACWSRGSDTPALFGPYGMGPPYSLKPGRPCQLLEIVRSDAISVRSPPTKESLGNVNWFTFGRRITRLNRRAGGFQGPGR